MNRFLATLALVLLAAFGGQTRAVAKMHVGQNIASGGFAANYDTRAWVDDAASLDIAGEADVVATKTASGRSKWLNRDPIGERGGVNLYGMCYNNPVSYYDYLGREPRPVSGGASMGNGGNSGENNLFTDVADKGAGGSGKGKTTPSGDELLNYFKELSKDNCCIKKLTIAGHGWRGPADGPGLPGKASGSGFYEDGAGGDKWATDPSSARMADLQNDIKNGDTKFCKPCEIKIHACNIASSFAESLGRTTGCKVTYAKGICSPRNNNKKWHSGVGDEDGYDSNDNGFWETNGGLPSTPIGNYTNP